MNRATIAAQLAKTQIRIAQTKQDIALIARTARNRREAHHDQSRLDLLESALEMHIAIRARLSAELSDWSPY